jgi:hypothetical protein
MNRTKTHDDLLEAFGREGCPVCSLALRSVEAYLDSVSHEGGVTDPEVRDRIRESHGFCNEHAYLWLQGQHILGTAIIYEDVLNHLAGELRSLHFEKRGWLSGVPALPGLGGKGGRDLEALAPHRECLACRSLAEAEGLITDVLLESLREPEFGRAYAASPGLCLPHLRSALGSARQEGAFKLLQEAALARHEALGRELREIIRHHDYRFSREPWGEERGAERRAVRHAVGERGIRGLGGLDPDR